MADQGRSNDPEYERRRREAKRRRRARKRRIALIKRLVVFGILVVALILCVVFGVKALNKGKSNPKAESQISSDVQNSDNQDQNDPSGSSGQPGTEVPTGSPDAPAGSKEEVLASAYKMAAQYDYDGAIAKLQSYADQNDGEITGAIANYTTQRDSCVAVDVTTVPHVFFHSLINDNRGFIVSDTVPQGRVIANNAAMATVNEFNNVIQQMYDAGYVMISLDDMVIENADGTFVKNTNLKLPAGKKAFILSEDDLSYYHAYGEKGAQGYADKLVVDENGKVKAQYTNPQGETLIGDYDMVPLIDSFVEAHPDFAYHNARPTIALTGYNGVFGYVTNDYYKEGVNSEHLGKSQKLWLEAHPEYDYDTACAEATKVAEALKAAGWTFASHTYGHLDANTTPLENLQADHERWKIAVEKIIGKTNKIIFAFGADIGGAGEYTRDNAKYAYYYDQGFRMFCNCDGTFGWTQFNSNYIRTGRFAIDGFTLYQAITPEGNSYKRCSYNYQQLGVSNIASFFDPDRTTPIDSE